MMEKIRRINISTFKIKISDFRFSFHTYRVQHAIIMPHQRRARIFKPRHEKSHKELQVQERKRVNGLLGKAHQLFVKCDAKVALIVQYERTGRIYSYRSHDWPLSIHLKVKYFFAPSIT